MRCTTILLCLCAIALNATAGERLYKWVDENGKIQYSDKPPMREAEKGVTELSRQGLAIHKTEGLLTPEQRAARDAELAKQREEAQKQLEARRRDLALMKSFTKTSEIDAIRDRNIEQLAAGVQSDKQRVEAANKRIEAFQKQVDRFVKSKKPVPDDMKADMAEKQAELAKINDHIAQQEKEIEQVKARAEADKKRLLELRGTSVQQ